MNFSQSASQKTTTTHIKRMGTTNTPEFGFGQDDEDDDFDDDVWANVDAR